MNKSDAVKQVLGFYRAMGVERVPMPDMEKGLKALRQELGECTRCNLHKGRTNLVFGEGNPVARLMLICEGPGKEEDQKRHMLMGEPGKLFDRLLNRMGFKREDIYVTGIVKCRPPGGRDPEDKEATTCREFLIKQIELVRPEVIMTIGRIAAHALLETKVPIQKIRGKFAHVNNIPVMPTYHPAYLLSNTKDKMLVWADAQEVLHKLGMEVK